MELDISPPDETPEWSGDPWLPSVRTVGVLLMLAGAIAFGFFTISGMQRSARAIERDPAPTPVQLERIVNRTEMWQQRSAALTGLGLVLVVASQVRARRART
jgi:hypothetical protein